MPRHSVTVGEALNEKISAFATNNGLSVSAAIALVLSQYFGVSAQDNTHGGYREESPAYWAGYNWGREACENNLDLRHDEIGSASLPDWEAWIDGTELKHRERSFNAWCRGAKDGLIAFGLVER